MPPKASDSALLASMFGDDAGSSNEDEDDDTSEEEFLLHKVLPIVIRKWLVMPNQANYYQEKLGQEIYDLAFIQDQAKV